MIKLLNNGNAIELKWDGVIHKIAKGKSIEVERGVAEHWIGKNPKAKLTIEEIEPEQPDKRDPENPLEVNDRGKAFSELN